VLAILWISTKKIIALFGLKSKHTNRFYWYATFLFIFVLSTELDHAVLMLSYRPSGDVYHILNQNHKIGFPILWGLLSFTLIVIGMRKKLKMLRIIALSLFLLILLKLFIVDLRGISEGGKIAAFICLGVLLLIISFMYQKLKRLVFEDEINTATL
jgi:uncharacterized membrane protein